jgi:hypothetical protein
MTQTAKSAIKGICAHLISLTSRSQINFIVL